MDNMKLVAGHFSAILLSALMGALLSIPVTQHHGFLVIFFYLYALLGHNKVANQVTKLLDKKFR